MMSPRPTQQIELLESARAGDFRHPLAVTKAQREADLETFRNALLANTGPWPLDFHLRIPPSAVYIPRHHITAAERLQIALDKALTSIISRWFTDERANFPARMPLKDHEERVLRWMEGDGRSFCRTYSERKALFRPDFLIEEVRDSEDSVKESISVCELNARMPYNAFFIGPYLSQIFKECVDIKRLGLKETVGDFPEIEASIFGFFDTDKPVHILKDKFPGADIHFFARLYESKFGQRARFVKPTDLRLLEDEKSATGYKLYCLAEGATTASLYREGEALEPVCQVSIELMQPEFDVMSFEMMCQVATCCINPMRNIFLINDERILGIIYDELGNLVSTKVLTSGEAETIQKGIAASFLPSSAIWQSVAERCRTDDTFKDKWVLKASRDAFGNGHFFGLEMTNDEWLNKLATAKACNSHPSGASFILQRRIEQTNYDIVRHEVEEGEKYHLVGSYLSLNGKFVGLGPWRIARRTHISVNATEGGIGMVAFTDA